MDQPQKPVAPRGGRVLAKVAAVLLALGVLGYLMWRSQGSDDRVEDLGEYRPIPCVGDFGSVPSLPEQSRLNLLFSSKFGVIERRLSTTSEQESEDQKPDGNALDVTPEPEAPR